MKYLYAVLTVIAVCLLLITCSLLEIFPSARAGTSFPPALHVNPDGTFNVRIVHDNAAPMQVNLVEINSIKFPEGLSDEQQPAINMKIKK